MLLCIQLNYFKDILWFTIWLQSFFCSTNFLFNTKKRYLPALNQNCKPTPAKSGQGSPRSPRACCQLEYDVISLLDHLELLSFHLERPWMHFFFDFSILSWHFGLPMSLNEVQTHFGCLNSFCGDGRLLCRSSDIHSVPVAILSLIVKAQGVPIVVLICTTWNPATIWCEFLECSWFFLSFSVFFCLWQE